MFSIFLAFSACSSLDICFQGENSTCPQDRNYTIIINSENLTDLITPDVEYVYLAVVNSKENILYINPAKFEIKTLTICGYDNSFINLPLNSQKLPILDITNINVILNDSKIEVNSVTLSNITFDFSQKLEIHSKYLKSDLNSLQNVEEIISDIVDLSGLPSVFEQNKEIEIKAKNYLILNVDNNDINLGVEEEEITVKYNNSKVVFEIESKNLTFNLLFDSVMNIEFDDDDDFEINKLNINAISENARVVFQHEKLDKKNFIKNIEMTCAKELNIEINNDFLPLSVHSCPNPTIIFSNENYPKTTTFSINSLVIEHGGELIINSKTKEDQEIKVEVENSVTISPNCSLTIKEGIQLITKEFNSYFHSLPTQSTIFGQFYIDSNKFELFMFPISFQFYPFLDSTDHYFVINSRQFPFEIREISESTKINLFLSDDYLLPNSNFVGSINIISNYNRNLTNIELLFSTEWNSQQKSCVSLYQNGTNVEIKFTENPALYHDKICFYSNENDLSACNSVFYKVQQKQMNIIENLTYSKDVTLFIASKETCQLNLINLESVLIQEIPSSIKSVFLNSFVNSIVIDNNEGSSKSLALRNIKVSFTNQQLNYKILILEQGVELLELTTLSFDKIQSLEVDMTLAKYFPIDEYSNVKIIGNIVQNITFNNNEFVFGLTNDQIKTINANDYNETAYPFIFGQVNLTLIKGSDQISPFTVTIQEHEPDFYLIVDSSFGNDDLINQIKIIGNDLSILTYSSIVPFVFENFSSIFIKSRQDFRITEFSSLVSINNDKTLILSCDNEAVIQFDNIFLENNTKLTSESSNIKFKQITLNTDSNSILSGVSINGKLISSGKSTIQLNNNSLLSEATIEFNAIFGENIPNLIFDSFSDMKSISLILTNSTNEPTIGDSFSFPLLSVENSNGYECTNVLSKVTFNQSGFIFNNGNPDNKVLELEATCVDSIVYVNEIIKDGSSGGDNDNQNGKMGLYIGVGSGVLIVIIIVVVAIILRKNYKDGDSDVINEELNPDDMESII